MLAVMLFPQWYVLNRLNPQFCVSVFQNMIFSSVLYLITSKEMWGWSELFLFPLSSAHCTDWTTRDESTILALNLLPDHVRELPPIHGDAWLFEDSHFVNIHSGQTFGTNIRYLHLVNSHTYKHVHAYAYKRAQYTHTRMHATRTPCILACM